MHPHLPGSQPGALLLSYLRHGHADRAVWMCVVRGDAEESGNRGAVEMESVAYRWTAMMAGIFGPVMGPAGRFG